MLLTPSAALLRKDVHGVALVEFALILPVLLILSLGIVEVAHYLLFREKLESSTSQMLDIVNQNNNVTSTSLNNLYSALPVMMRPYDIGKAPRIIVTQIERPPNDPSCKPVAVWQYPIGNSRVAPAIGNFADTRGITLAPADHLLAIEVFATYTPLINNQFTRELLTGTDSAYVVHYQHTRYGAFKISPNTGQVVSAPCKQ